MCLLIQDETQHSTASEGSKQHFAINVDLADIQWLQGRRSQWSRLPRDPGLLGSPLQTRSPGESINLYGTLQLPQSKPTDKTKMMGDANILYTQ